VIVVTLGGTPPPGFPYPIKRRIKRGFKRGGFKQGGFKRGFNGGAGTPHLWFFTSKLFIYVC
jgi:hypothetical protein